jgi:hypothetical protein
MITTYNNPLRNFWDIWNNKSLRNFGIVGFFWNRMGNSWFVKFLNRVPFFYVTWWFRQKLFSTEAFTHQKKCPAVFFPTESSPHRSLTHRRFYAQHFLHTDAFTYWCIYTDTNCRQKLVHTVRVYTANFYTERLRFPFLITYLSCSPSQVLSGHGVFFVLKTMILDMSRLAYHKHFETAPGIEMTAMGGPLWNIYWRFVLLYILVILVLLVYTYNTKMHICVCDT